MIFYNNFNKSFLISGKNYSYAVFVNENGSLQSAYYGKKISPSDLSYIIKRACADRQVEYSGFGRMDFRAPTALIKQADGSSLSHYIYKTHKITEGAASVTGMPCIRHADHTLTITLRDEFSNIEIDLNYWVLDDSDVLVRNSVIRNCGTSSVNVTRAFSFCIDLPDICQYSALRLVGNWASERTPVTTPLRDGTLRIESSKGYSSHQMNPFIGILEDDCSENHGICYGFNLIYSGSFAITAEIDSENYLRVQGGISDLNFSWLLNASEELHTPQTAICYSNEGIGKMSREYHDFFRNYIIDPKYVYRRRPIVVNNWEATYFDFDSEKLFAIIDEARDTGIDTFVLDDGWFGERNSDNGALGDWFVNEKKLCGGLKAVSDRCKQNGLNFGLWIEPEAISENSELYRAHPDWAIQKPGVKPCTGRNQLILDFTRKEIVDHVFNVISNIIANNDISYIKWDKNRDMSEFYSLALPAERQGEFAHRYVLGFYDLAKRLTEAFPNVLFEGCAGGGGRFDGGALYYFPQIWTSDDTDGLERTKIQWGTSICYPLSSMSCHVSACPNHQTQRITPFETRGNIASLGPTGYELDLTKLNNDEKRQVMEQTQAYNEIAELVLKGDLYRLSDPFDTNYFCEMVISKDKSEAYVVGERFRGMPCDHDRILRFFGLDSQKTYHIRELDITASGSALMNGGVLYPRLADSGSWAWHIKEYLL